MRTAVSSRGPGGGEHLFSVGNEGERTLWHGDPRGVVPALTRRFRNQSSGAGGLLFAETLCVRPECSITCVCFLLKCIHVRT